MGKKWWFFRKVLSFFFTKTLQKNFRKNCFRKCLVWLTPEITHGGRFLEYPISNSITFYTPKVASKDQNMLHKN